MPDERRLSDWCLQGNHVACRGKMLSILPPYRQTRKTCHCSCHQSSAKVTAMPGDVKKRAIRSSLRNMMVGCALALACMGYTATRDFVPAQVYGVPFYHGVPMNSATTEVQ